MGLDVRTMIFMTVALTSLLSGILALAGLHSGIIRGVRQWASANLLISMGLGLAFTPLVQSPWMFVMSNFLVAIGVGLQITGIQAFEEGKSDWRIPVTLASLSLVLNIWFAILSPSVTMRIITNSLLLAYASIACARALLIRIEPPLRTAYWLTGSAFALLAAAMLARIGAIIAIPPTPAYLLTPALINLTVFFLTSLTQLCTAFGFILMLNYRLSNDLKHLAARDSLTNALNRRSFEEVANQLQAHFSRSGGHIALLMLDIDHFKAVNDRYGHPVGDAVLKVLSTIVHNTIRTADYFARYGGEEFCILLPNTTREEACILADRIRLAFAKTTINCGKNAVLCSTISIGVTDSFLSGLTLKELVADADNALYHAKQTGRNRTVVAFNLSKNKTPESNVTPTIAN